jgi:FAD:protein FMN transferase
MTLGERLIRWTRKPTSSTKASPRRAWCLLLALATLTGNISNAASSRRVVAWQGPTMGTRYSVKLVEPDEANLSKPTLVAAVEAVLETINDQMSTYRPDSEISRFNQAEPGVWIDVSPQVVRVVEMALRIGRQSRGAYDITIGPLVRLWHFGPQPQERKKSLKNVRKEPPDAAAIEQTLSKMGIGQLLVRNDPPALQKKIAGLEIDLSSIAKGYAVDRVGQTLADRGIVDAMVEIGGEVRTWGQRQGGGPWRIGIERPDEGNRLVQQIIPLVDMAVATSGDYRNFFETGGTRYSHLLDPRTGRPVAHTLASVSVLAASCMEADALATTLLVLGPEEGLHWARQENLAASFLARQAGTEDGTIVQLTTTRFTQLASGKPAASKESAPADGAEDRAEDLSIGELFLITFAAFAVVMVAMAIGVLLKGRCLRGSCGGLAGLRDEQGRPMCAGCDRRDKAEEEQSSLN